MRLQGWCVYRRNNLLTAVFIRGPSPKITAHLMLLQYEIAELQLEMRVTHGLPVSIH